MRDISIICLFVATIFIVNCYAEGDNDAQEEVIVPTKTAVSKYENGQKSSEGPVIEGEGTNYIRHGKWIWWHENGQKQKEDNYKKGKLDGKYVEWYPNGQKKIETTMKDGEIHGKVILWHDNGQLYRTGKYKNGKPHGLFIQWDKEGNKTGETEYIDGKAVEKAVDKEEQEIK